MILSLHKLGRLSSCADFLCLREHLLISEILQLHLSLDNVISV